MFTFESGKRGTCADDRAHDTLAASAAARCTPEDVAAALRVLDAMGDRGAVEKLARHIATDSCGNPLIDTPERHLAQATWSEANELGYRLESIRAALAHAAT